MTVGTTTSGYNPPLTGQKLHDVMEMLRSKDTEPASKEFVANGIRNHDKSYVAKPEQMTYATGAKLFAAAAEEEKQIQPFSKTFNYRPWDVALSMHRVCTRVFGHSPFGVKGRHRKMTIPTGPNGETVTVDWGQSSMPELEDAIFVTEEEPTPLYGVLGRLTIHVKVRLLSEVRGLLNLIEEDVKKNSIYRGKAITSETMPRFLDPYVTNREHIVWSTTVDAALRGALLNVIRHTDRARERNIKRHRSVLFYGEPGNGKSETINIVAQEAIEHGWTYVMCTTTLREALQTARLLSPAVIAAEDFERLIANATEEERNELLEEMDGTTSKGKEIMFVSTTNFIEDLYQAARRRMFKEIEFGPLDLPGIERYLRIKLAGQAAEDFDYAAAAAPMEDWGNSYIEKATAFSTTLALDNEKPRIRTQDIVDAAAATLPEWEGYKASKARPVESSFEKSFEDLVVKTLERRVSLAYSDQTDDYTEFASK